MEKLSDTKLPEEKWTTDFKIDKKINNIIDDMLSVKLIKTINWHLITAILMSLILISFAIYTLYAFTQVNKEIRRVDERLTSETELWMVGEKMITV